MNALAQPCRRTARGFTLYETIIVIGILGLASAGIMRVQGNLHATQASGRDQVVAVDLMRACGERLLTVRRELGFSQVTTTTCNNMAGISGFATHPSVTLTNDAGTGVTTCASTFCTATITVPKSGGGLPALAAVTLRLHAY